MDRFTALIIIISLKTSDPDLAAHLGVELGEEVCPLLGGDVATLLVGDHLQRKAVAYLTLAAVLPCASASRWVSAGSAGPAWPGPASLSPPSPAGSSAVVRYNLYSVVLAWCQWTHPGQGMERLYMEAQDGLKTIAPPLFLNIFFYFLLV